MFHLQTFLGKYMNKEGPLLCTQKWNFQVLRYACCQRKMLTSMISTNAASNSILVAPYPHFSIKQSISTSFDVLMFSHYL